MYYLFQSSIEPPRSYLFQDHLSEGGAYLKEGGGGGLFNGDPLMVSATRT